MIVRRMTLGKDSAFPHNGGRLDLHYLSVWGEGGAAAMAAPGRQYAADRRPCICADVYLLSAGGPGDAASYPCSAAVACALLGSLLDILCPGGLQNAAAVLRCGPGGEETARAALAVLARRARYVRLDMEDPSALAAELLYRWGIAAGDGGRRAALTVVCGDVREDTEGPAIYLTEDCGARQTPVWTSPRAAALAVPVTEPLAAVLTAAGKWQISDIHITDLLDIRTESHYNAT